MLLPNILLQDIIPPLPPLKSDPDHNDVPSEWRVSGLQGTHETDVSVHDFWRTHLEVLSFQEL